MAFLIHFFVVSLVLYVVSCIEASASIAERSPCSPLQLVIARGTMEPGTYGVIVGDPLFNATRALIPGATAYAVPYPASFAADSQSIGVADIISYMKSQPAACPQQKYVMVGYSQGGEVMHDALANAQFDQSLFPRIVALVMFGDPGNRGTNTVSPVTMKIIPQFPASLAQKLKENCQNGDPVCTNNGTQLADHLVYGSASYINSSATFIQKQFETDGKAGPELSPTNVGTETAGNIGVFCSLGASVGNSANPFCSQFQSGNSTQPTGSAPMANQTQSANSTQSPTASAPGVPMETTSGGRKRVALPAILRIARHVFIW